MKTLSALFSIYILLLIAAPCLDEHAVAVINGVENTGCHHNGHNADTDKCSPFCTCSCCSTTVIAHNIHICFFTTSLPEIPRIELPFMLVSIPPSSVWQPPNKA
jgi:hypothetical protein